MTLECTLLPDTKLKGLTLGHRRCSFVSSEDGTRWYCQAFEGHNGKHPCKSSYSLTIVFRPKGPNT